MKNKIDTISEVGLFSGYYLIFEWGIIITEK